MFVCSACCRPFGCGVWPRSSHPRTVIRVCLGQVAPIRDSCVRVHKSHFRSKEQAWAWRYKRWIPCSSEKVGCRGLNLEAMFLLEMSTLWNIQGHLRRYWELCIVVVMKVLQEASTQRELMVELPNPIYNIAKAC